MTEIGVAARCAGQDKIGQYWQMESRNYNLVALGLPESGRVEDWMHWLSFCWVSVTDPDLSDWQVCEWESHKAAARSVVVRRGQVAPSGECQKVAEISLFYGFCEG